MAPKRKNNKAQGAAQQTPTSNKDQEIDEFGQDQIGTTPSPYTTEDT
jgi:hypothetical protein